MVGDNVNSESWPNYGEIDVVEALGNSGQTNRTYADVHGPVVPADPTGNDQEWESFWAWPTPLTGVTHVYAINWNSTEITWTLDGVPYASATKASLAAGEPWLFDGSENFHLILDLAVGGWPGAASGWNTATMLVNWVRVYQ
jgi:beta-glucanase (GH16 family)